MPLKDHRTGFLGLRESAVSSPNSLVNCEKFQNCYAYKFTYNGIERSRMYRQDGVDKPFVNDDIFRCGVAAYYDKAKCRLDTRSMHLHTVFCTKTCTCNNNNN